MSRSVQITEAATTRPGGRDDWDYFFFTSIMFDVTKKIVYRIIMVLPLNSNNMLIIAQKWIHT